MTLSYCVDCGGEFYADFHWKIRCWQCYRRHKRDSFDRDSYDNPNPFERADRLQLLEQEIRSLRYQLETERAARAATPDGLDARRIRQLLQLAHPDKHANSSLSQEITRWLLEIRNK